MEFNEILQAPHCDPRVLHEPGKCMHCDNFPSWQELRQLWNINFTGESLLIYLIFVLCIIYGSGMSSND